MEHSDNNSNNSQQDPQPVVRKVSDVTLDYLAERCAMNEVFINNVLQTIVQFHPYLGSPLSEVVDGFNKAIGELDQRHPIGKIEVASAGGIILNRSKH